MPVGRQQRLLGACPHLFATVFDLVTNRTAKICGGSDVTVTSSYAYTTHGHRAAVVVHASSSSSTSGRSPSPLLKYFLIKCETVGCADFAPVDAAHVWTQRFGARMQLGCVTSSVTWQMFCVDGRWQGPNTSCTSSGDVTAMYSSNYPSTNPKPNKMFHKSLMPVQAI